jgi:SAM-dependent methyltransferase
MSNDTYSDRAHSGFADGTAYDQYRPSFPAESVEVLLEAVRVAGVAEAKVVDLGAGTGKFTEILARRNERFRITAVEPHQGMRQVLEAKQLANVVVQEGMANRIPVQDQSVDAVIVAQVRQTFPPCKPSDVDTLHLLKRWRSLCTCYRGSSHSDIENVRSAPQYLLLNDDPRIRRFSLTSSDYNQISFFLFFDDLCT